MTEENKPNQNDKPAVNAREEATLAFWQQNHIFEKTDSKDAPNGEFVFYDGPPFGTGLPHYGHLLAGSIKDVFPRYMTMRGYHVRRQWGWDCHGLPIENLIEKELNLGTKKDIEEYGIGNFNEHARSSVLTYRDEWKKIVPRAGRFVDMDKDYKTMNPSYTESVWWAFKTLYDKGLVYEDFKPMHVCPRCETTLSNFEVTLGYKDITDISVYVKFELDETKYQNTFMIAWTTTPWTLPGNVALALNKDAAYVSFKMEGNDQETYIVAKERLEHATRGKTYTVIEEHLGEEFLGLSYTPPFDYYFKKRATIAKGENAWKVYHADFVTTDAGTGIAHEAPAFGAEDKELADQVGLPLIHHVGMDGHFAPEVEAFAGHSVKPKGDHQATDIEVVKWLAHNHKLFEKEKIVHSYPHCWRCDTPLLNYATTSWFVRVTDLKDKLLAANKQVVWVPEHIRDGRFGRWLEGARDWAISRSRYWGAPLPVWKERGGKVHVFGNLEELKKNIKKSGNTYFAMRHGEGEHNVSNILSGKMTNEHHLTEDGKQTVREWAEKLTEKNIDVIIASPFVRTRETAAIAKEVLGFKGEVIYDERLVEFNFGEWEGQPFSQFLEFRQNMTSLNARFPGGESFREVKKRFGAFLYDIESKYQGKNILIVSHGCSVEAFASIVEGADEKKSVEYFSHKPIRAGTWQEIKFVPLPHNPDYELDFHRPYIDDVVLETAEGEALTRVNSVFDCWFESGSMPFAQFGYKGDDGAPEGCAFRANFPADFIAEGVDQTRGWFYSLIILGVGLFGQSPYKRVIVNGMVLAEDGQKMSKSKKNYPELVPTLEKYGADAMRLYILSQPVVKGEDFNFSEKELGETYRKNIGRLENVFEFYKLYRDPYLEICLTWHESAPKQVLNQWILLRLKQTIRQVETAMAGYELDAAIRPLESFIDDLSTWYLRRSREAIKDGDFETKQTLYVVLKTFARVFAPFAPFASDFLWQELKHDKDPESVHLVSWPEFPGDVNTALLDEMSLIRDVVTRGLEARQKAGIKVRQPLAALAVPVVIDPKYIAIIQDELNVKEVRTDDLLDTGTVSLNTTITDALKREGDLRELIRTVQDLRKERGLTPDQSIALTLPAHCQDLVKEFEGEFTKKVLADKLVFEGEVLQIG